MLINRKFGNQRGMKQTIDPVDFGRRVRERREELGLGQTALGKLSGQSQSNIAWLESGKSKDPRLQAQDLAEGLRTTYEWLAFGTGLRETAPAPMTPEDVAGYYKKLPPAQREAISEQILKFASADKKQRRTVNR